MTHFWLVKCARFVESVHGIMEESVKCHLNQNTNLAQQQKIKQVVAEKLVPAATLQLFSRMKQNFVQVRRTLLQICRSLE